MPRKKLKSVDFSMVPRSSDSVPAQGSSPILFRAAGEADNAGSHPPPGALASTPVLPAGVEHPVSASSPESNHTTGPIPAPRPGATTGRDDLLARIEAWRPGQHQQNPGGKTRSDEAGNQQASKKTTTAAPEVKAKKSRARSATPSLPNRSPYNLRSRRCAKNANTKSNTDPKDDLSSGL
ncbi:hypothetical protein VTG60DRAFT_3790 [Thermothelomyces hinnuleus]